MRYTGAVSGIRESAFLGNGGVIFHSGYEQRHLRLLHTERRGQSSLYRSRASQHGCFGARTPFVFSPLEKQYSNLVCFREDDKEYTMGNVYMFNKRKLHVENKML